MKKKITIKKDLIDFGIEIIGFFAIIVLFVLPFYYLKDLPETIPTHFNSYGEADGFGNKNTVWILPIIGLFLFLGMYFLNKAPHLFNYPVKITDENREIQYKLATKLFRLTNSLIALLFTFLTYESITTALDGTNAISSFGMISFIGLLVLVIIIYIIKSLKSK